MNVAESAVIAIVVFLELLVSIVILIYVLSALWPDEALATVCVRGLHKVK